MLQQVLQHTMKKGTVDFSGAKLCMYYSDMFWKNFPVDRQGQTWVVDFDHSGVLIQDLQSLVLDTTIRHPLPVAYRNKIPIDKSQNLKAMVRAWSGLQTSADCAAVSSALCVTL
jgi:hypothetical protein